MVEEKGEATATEVVNEVFVAEGNGEMTAAEVEEETPAKEDEATAVVSRRLTASRRTNIPLSPIAGSCPKVE